MLCVLVSTLVAILEVGPCGVRGTGWMRKPGGSAAGIMALPHGGATGSARRWISADEEEGDGDVCVAAKEME